MWKAHQQHVSNRVLSVSINTKIWTLMHVINYLW